MDSKLLKYHPMRFELIRGGDDDRLDFWEDLEQWQKDTKSDPTATYASGGISFDRKILATLEEMEDRAWYTFNYFEDAGRNIFSLSPALVQMFLHSSVDEVPTSLVRMPFSSMFLHFGAEAGLRSAISGLPLDGVYIHASLTGSAHDSLHLLGTPVAPWIEEARRWPFARRIQEDAKLGYLEQFLGFDDGKTFGEILAAPFKNPYAEQTEIEYWRDRKEIRRILNTALGVTPYKQAVEEWKPSEEDALWKEQTRLIANLVVNALCYLVYDQREVDLDYPDFAHERLVRQTSSNKPTEVRRAQSKLEAMGYRKVYLCGRSFCAPSPGQVGAHSLSAHWRRGHWRQQACGPSLRDRKLMWIMPTLVNAQDGQMVHGHVYDAGAPTGSSG